jgi:hypothetical protein
MKTLPAEPVIIADIILLNKIAVYHAIAAV